MNIKENRYTQDMRASGESCPYCGMWHTSMSCHPGVIHMTMKIRELEAENERLREHLVIDPENFADTMKNRYGVDVFTLRKDK